MFTNIISTLSSADAVSTGDLISAFDSVSASDVVSAADAGFRFEPDNFIQALPTIGICLLSIFAVMAAIILVTSLLNKITAGGSDKEDE